MAIRSALGGGRDRLIRQGLIESTLLSLAGGLLVTEVALTFVLLVGAGLLLQSFLRLLAVEPGYEPDRVLMATLDPGSVGPEEPGRGAAFFDELLERLEKQPAVEAAGVVSFPPLPQSFSMTSVAVVGEPPGRTLAVPQDTSAGSLRAMGLRLAEGRWLPDGSAPQRMI